jgi:hypothetical protein
MDALKQKAKNMVTTREGALGAAALVASAVGAYFFWPAAATSAKQVISPSW